MDKRNISLIRFSPGELVIHKTYGYRGVIIEVDERFIGTDEIYEETTVSNPPKDKPWYHVLVDGSDYVTYVAEGNLQRDSSTEPISHPQVTEVFAEFKNGRYMRALH